ncbi:hypothetical protein ALC56_03184 [Trachymyrmex septentrionalis]|uniref:Uncharacterized protein n=1 Tax=Trachymyrmex septentrionalis TaxID=34720 RepID=A0A151JZV6_9HYME|nr:hypothetical protein ALC56_03184 [Trachymyrmex septentrionalis]
MDRYALIVSASGMRREDEWSLATGLALTKYDHDEVYRAKDPSLSLSLSLSLSRALLVVVGEARIERCDRGLRSDPSHSNPGEPLIRSSDTRVHD